MEISNIDKSLKQIRKNKPKTDLNAMMLGKVPPQARDLEKAVLGAILLENGVFNIVNKFLKDGYFYEDKHNKIFEACNNLNLKNDPIDFLTIIEELKNLSSLEDVGGEYYIVKLTNSVVSTANVENHSKIVLQKHIQREIIRISGEIITEAYEHSADVFELNDTALTKYLSIANLLASDSNVRSLADMHPDILNEIEFNRQNKREIIGYKTGFEMLDFASEGLQKGVTVIAARPAVGKSAFILNMALGIATAENLPVLIFNLEMSAKQTYYRNLANISNIDVSRLKKGNISNDEMEKLNSTVTKKINETKIFIDDTPGVTINTLRAKAKQFKAKHGECVIMIDYLQLMSGSGDKSKNREGEVADISRGLVLLRKELDCPIVALSQLSREVEKRSATAKGKVPQLADLRESGSIEQDADNVWFIYPSVLDTQNDSLEVDYSKLKYVTINGAKTREGNNFDVHFAFDGAKQRLMELGLDPYHNNLYQKKKGNNDSFTPFKNKQNIEVIENALEDLTDFFNTDNELAF